MGNAFLAMGAAVLLASCGSASESMVETTVDTDNGAMVAAPDPARAGEHLRLEPDGLSFVVTEGGDTRLARFGTERARIVDAAGATLGAALNSARRGDCPDGPLEAVLFPAGMTLFFGDGQFVGWNLVEPGGHIATGMGIGIGSTRGELERTYAFRMRNDSSLGHEFKAGRLHGLLTGTGEEAKVTRIWAGKACIRR